MRKNLALSLLVITMLTGLGTLLSACNTIHGMGQDIESASDAIKSHL